MIPSSRAETESPSAAFASVLASAIRRRFLTYRRVADELGDLDEGAIRGWVAGHAVPAPEVVFRLEQCLALRPGHLSGHLGYVPIGHHVPCPVEEAINADPLLADGAREALRDLYRRWSTGAAEETDTTARSTP